MIQVRTRDSHASVNLSSSVDSDSHRESQFLKLQAIRVCPIDEQKIWGCVVGNKNVGLQIAIQPGDHDAKSLSRSVTVVERGTDVTELTIA